MQKTVAFFGLGAMGAPMAENLLRAGYSVHTSINRSRKAADDLAARYGLEIFAAPGQAAAGADYIITILPADPQIKGFLMQETLAEAMKPGAVIIDMSSCTTSAICEVEDWYSKYDIPVVDAPVSGGVTGAVKGTLTIFASGKAEVVAAVKPVLEVMGSTVFELGACGTGKAFKNLNNLLSTANLMIMTEMFHAARKQGFDMDKLYDVICVSSGASASFKNRFKKMVNEDFEGGFKLSLARKDVGNALKLGDGVPMPICSAVYQLMLACSAYDDLDMSAMCKLFD